LYPGQAESKSASPEEPTEDQALATALRAAVSEQIGAHRFNLWFGEDVRLGLSDGGEVLEVQVPNTFFREWIQGHFAANLVEAVRSVTGRQVRLSFTIRTENIPALAKSTLIKPPQARLSSEYSSNGQVSLLDVRRPPELIRTVRMLNSFVTGSCNQLAYAAAREMIQTGGTSFNPLVIYGGVGLGKTHLLEAITHGLRQARPSLNVLLITAEAFTNGFLESMRAGTLTGFRTRYRGLGGLAMDDVHFLAGTRATQNEFLHTFNSLTDRGAPIILTADDHPRRISRLTEELITRFLGGMVVKLESPDPVTRQAILRARSQARGITVPESVIEYIAEHLRSSIRELEGAIHSVIAHAALSGKRLDLALARAALRETIHHTSQAIGLRDVERAVCQLFQISADALRSDSRVRALVYPRMLAMYLARKHTDAAYSEIGRYFGDRNHSTVISADKKVQGWLRDEEQNALLPGFETIADILTDLERTLGT
jgi:chromosomal replication initiator protein